ncbi:MAG TPA: nucleoside triphosphate pyrophosphohydrolase [Acidimicrobiia bacterium]|nr:nucleoside triphosphate pyrophosphohydrolase [Acidimicrobiia bacterium]
MGPRTTADGAASHQLTISGLGAGALSRLPAAHRAFLAETGRTVVVRTIHHPAAADLAEIRPVVACDDLYEESEHFDDVYDAIVARVRSHLELGPTVYAVPGSPLVGEFAVRHLLRAVPEAELMPAESFVDAVLRRVGYDPLSRGLRIINGHEVPDPLVLDAPTIVAHLDRPEILAEVAAILSRVLPEGAEVSVCANVGGDDEMVLRVPVDRVPPDLAGFRTSLFVDTEAAGLFGLIGVSRRLRRECPWDRAQTHVTLVRHLLEEAYELIEAISGLPDDGEEVDFVAYDAVEEELGDVLLQVLFHAVIAAERGAFGIDDVATRLREKLVRRHPHVFGDVEVADADEVASNWAQIKEEEKGTAASLMDGIPVDLPALERAAAVQRRAAEVGFDWKNAGDITGVLREEVTELEAAMQGDGSPAHELGDVLFTAVNLLRRLDSSGEVVLRQATNRFERRFRAMEAGGPLEGLPLDEMERRWQAAKREEA